MTKTRHAHSLGYLDEPQKLYDDPLAYFGVKVEVESEAARAGSTPITVIFLFEKLLKMKSFSNRIVGQSPARR